MRMALARVVREAITVGGFVRLSWGDPWGGKLTLFLFCC